jgi:5-methylcytosine-specific restriction enzyme A
VAGFYSTASWRALRWAQLSKEPLCRMCQSQGRLTPATVADHVVPHRGDWDAFVGGELQSLCKTCHDGAKQSLEKGGRLRGCDAEGWPLDPSHHWNR